jgi:signal transduction histidine kinase
MGISSDIISVEKLTANENDVVLDDITQTEELDGGLRVKVRMNNGLMITDANDHELYTITEADGLCSNQVAYVAYDGHGMLWGATSHGVFAIEMPSVYSYILGKDGLAGEVYAITAFDGDFYVGGTNGLYRISSRQCQRIETVSNICWALCHQGDYMLAATSSGIYRLGRGRSVSRLTSNATTALLVEGDKVYAGEADAVWLYQGDFTLRTKVADMPLVTDIRSDGHGHLWLQNVYGDTSGNDPGKPREPLEELPEHLLKPLSDIEVKTQFRYGEQYWIGGDEVVAVIDTGKQQLAKLTEGSLVRFTSIVLGNDSVHWGGYGEMPEQLKKIDSDNRHLHFYYALSYAQLSGKTLYRYRLNTDNWSAWTEKQDIEFLNMPYGSYTLSVQAQQASGELSEIATVSFSIAYPLLMRWYMVAVYFMLAGYLVWLLFRYRLKRLQKDKIKLERIVEQRTSEVVKQKDEIVRQKDEIEEKSKSLEKALDDLSSAQHELIRQEKMATVGKLTEGLIDRILNPMNFIINFSKMSSDLLSDIKTNIDSNKERINADDYDDTLDMLGMLTENLQHVEQNGQSTTHMLKAMREILKDRTGGYVDMDLLPVLQRNEEMFNNSFAKEKEQHHISFSVRLPAEAMPLHGNPDMLSKTVMSLLGNAVHAIVKKAQHISYAPEVSLTATATGHHYTLRIRDNGIGIEEKILPKIFDPFFTTKTTQEAAGVGLYLSREIIQNHGGDITVESALDQYTEFTVTLPKLKR